MAFINFSNHNSKDWSQEQLDSAEKYGEIVDFPFPPVNPHWTTEEVRDLAKKCTEEIINMNPSAVMAQGEFTLVYNVVKLLKKRDVVVLASCTDRVAEESIENGVITKKSIFKFAGFREY